jgi:serine/threonine protein phosphatase PrpC
MSRDEAQNHPSRNILTSVIMGAAIPKVDCVSQPFEMKAGDVILIASDGLQYIKEPLIQAILRKIEGANSEEIAYALMRTIEQINDPDQDNVSLGVVVPVIN